MQRTHTKKLQLLKRFPVKNMQRILAKKLQLPVKNMQRILAKKLQLLKRFHVKNMQRTHAKKLQLLIRFHVKDMQRILRQKEMHLPHGTLIILIKRT